MIKKKLLAAAVAVTMSTAMIASMTTSVFAADSAQTKAEASANDQAKNQAAEKDFVKESEDALSSMQDVHGARLALFNGHPEKALTFVDAAVTRIDAASKEADQFALDTKAPKADDSYVPFDAGLSVVHSFEPTPEKVKQIAKAKKHMEQGEKKEAIESLKLAEIDVAVTTKMVPVKYAKEHIDRAAKLVADHKYYEANLALKAVDDAVLVETYAIDSVPKTKAEGKG